MKIRLSRLAVEKLENLVDYLTENWSPATTRKFISTFNSKVEIIKSNPEIYPESKTLPGLRKCLVSKQTSFIYEVHSDEIFILTIIDNRQAPEKLEKEIKKHFS